MINRMFLAAVQTIQGYIKKRNFTKKSGMIMAAMIIAASACLIFVFNRMDGGEVTALAVTSEDYEEKIVAVGQLQLARETTIIAEVSGEILTIGAEEGDSISAGSIMISIDDEGLGFQLEQKNTATRTLVPNIKIL